MNHNEPTNTTPPAQKAEPTKSDTVAEAVKVLSSTLDEEQKLFLKHILILTYSEGYNSATFKFAYLKKSVIEFIHRVGMGI